MKQVYKCEFCDEIMEDKNEMDQHEIQCGSNPKNKINDEIVIKLSRLYEHFKESLVFVLLNDFKEEKIKFYEDEFERASTDNCPASVYESKRDLKDMFIDVRHFRYNETKYFNDIVRRDNPEFIEAIRTFLREPEFRIKKD